MSMRAIILPIMLSFLVLLSACESTKPELDRDAQLDALINDIVGEDIPGLILILDTPGAPYRKAAGYENKDTEAAMRADATLRLGSITKSYMAALTLRLSDDGMIELDKPISTYLNADTLSKLPEGLDPTIRQLLNHTSGVPDYYSERFYKTDWDRSQPLTPKLVLHAIRDLPATSEPGGEFAYSNTNYHLIALALEAVSGNSVKELLSAHIFAPLMLEETYYGVETPPGDTIHGYGSPFGDWEDTFSFRENSGPDGGMFGSADDVAQWMRALYAETGAFYGFGQRMSVNPVQERERKYQGLGVEILISRSGAKVLGHTGAIDGYLSAAFYIPDADTVMVLHMNRFDDATFSQTLSRVLKIIMSTAKK